MAVSIRYISGSPSTVRLCLAAAPCRPGGRGGKGRSGSTRGPPVMPGDATPGDRGVNVGRPAGLLHEDGNEKGRPSRSGPWSAAVAAARLPGEAPTRTALCRSKARSWSF
jgi:hypothetical protein